MAFVGGLVGHAHGQEGDYGGQQIEAGMQRFGQDAKAVGAHDEKGLEGQQHDGGAHAENRGALLFADFLSLAQGQHGSLDDLKSGSYAGQLGYLRIERGHYELREMKRSAAEFMQ